MSGADVVLDIRTTIAEGPVWDGRIDALRWVDIRRGQIHVFDPATGGDDSFDVGTKVGAVAVRASGGLVLATARGFESCDDDGGNRRLVASVATDPPGGRMNDGKCDAQGRFWAGSNDGGPGAAALHRLDPDGSVHRLLTGVTTSNGLGWSPDETVMYYTDSPTGGVDAFDFDAPTGSITARRRLITPSRGRPDGLTVDSEGCLWVALWDGWAVQRFAPDGRLIGTVEIPVRRVTSCAFGGPDLGTLYVTTASPASEDAAPQPHAGSIFALAPGTAGRPAHPWRG